MNQLITLTEERREDFEERFVVDEGFVNIPDGKAVVAKYENTRSHHTATLIALTNALIEKMKGELVDVKCLTHDTLGKCDFAHNSALTTQITHLTEYRDYLIKK